MVCGHWLRNLPMVPLPSGRAGKYSGLDPCHLLSLHRSKAVSLWRHELAGAGHQAHKSVLMKTCQGLQSLQLCSVDTEQPLAHSIIKTTVSFPPGAFQPMESTDQFPHSCHS